MLVGEQSRPDSAHPTLLAFLYRQRVPPASGAAAVPRDEIIMRKYSRPIIRFIGFLLPLVCAVGCNSVSSGFTATVPASTTRTIEGSVFGGQQPVVGAKIQLYAAGAPTTGGGYGLGATPLITGTLPTTNSSGGFTITGDYTLPSTPSHLYIVATGGSSATGNPANSDIALMAVLEGCTPSSALSSSLFININEVTTVASVLALKQFIATPVAGNLGAPAIGAPATAYNALQNAFATANDLANISTGTALMHINNFATTDNNGLLINSLADILAYCVNSNTSTSSQCPSLFSNATPTGAGYSANDTIQAAWYMAQNPTTNVPALFNLASSSPPFVGLSTAPANFNVTVATSASACQSPVPLGSAGNYAVLAGTSVTNSSTSSDQTVITGGDVGVSPGTSETGFVTGTYSATIDNTDAAAAEGALTAAYNTAAGLLSPAALPGDMSGLTFSPGLYNTGSAVSLNSGSVTLDAQGDPNAVFVFQIGSTLIAASGTQVILANGAQSGNVFWQVGSSATLNSSAAFVGNIIAYTTVTLGTDANLHGRAMASNGAVTLLSNKITIP
jgi:Ice-binding-like